MKYVLGFVAFSVLIFLIRAIIGGNRFVFIDVYVKTKNQGSNRSVRIKKDTHTGKYFIPTKKIGLSQHEWEELPEEFARDLKRQEERDDIYLDLQKFKPAS